MSNFVLLIGNLTRDPEIRRTQNGKAVANFTLAVAKQFKRDETDFINCVAWEKTAELIEKYVTKGNKIAVQGSIQTRNYDGNDGKKVYVTEILVNNVQFLDSKRESNQQGQSYQNQANQAVSSQNSGYSSNDTVYDIMNDDIEF